MVIERSPSYMASGIWRTLARTPTSTTAHLAELVRRDSSPIRCNMQPTACNAR